jgi:agmatine deiminase
LINENYAALSYLNFYLCNNGGLIIAQFGDEGADREAYEVLSKIYPERTIEQLNIDSLIMTGGGVHCATQQEPVYE